MNAKGEYCLYHDISVEQITLEGTQYGYAEFPEIDSEKVAKTCTDEGTCGGYDFKGNEEHFTMVLPENRIIENAHQTFYVYYERNRYTLTMDPDTGVLPVGTTLPDGTVLTEPSNKPFVAGEYYFNQTVKLPALGKDPERNGYGFSAWMTADNNTWSGKMDSANLVLVPKFQAKWSDVYFWIADFTYYTTLHGVTDAPLTMPAAPKRDGYTFKGWDQTFDKFPAGGADVYALWEAKEYKITFNANKPTDYQTPELSGTMAPVSGYKYYTDQALPANQYKVAGYAFKGWNTQANGKGVSVSDMGMVGTTVMGDFATDELVLYAQWEKKPTRHYAITFQLMNTNGEYVERAAAYATTYEGDVCNIEKDVRGSSYLGNPDGFYLDGIDYNVVIENAVEGANGYWVVDSGIKIERRKFELKWDLNGGMILGSDYTPDGMYYYGAAIKYPSREALTYPSGGYKFAAFKDTYADSYFVLPNMPARDVLLRAEWEKF